VTWRFEPSPRGADPADGLAARVFDPLWFLTRQWQVGEFAGTDGGTAIRADISYGSSPIVEWQPAGASSPIPYEPSGAPLEAVIEGEAPDPTDLRLRIEAGARLRRMLGEALSATTTAADIAAAQTAVQQAYPFVSPLPAPTGMSVDPLLAGVATRVPDGQALAQALNLDQPAYPDAPAFVAPVATAWLQWWNAQVAMLGPVAFDSARMEYGFTLRTSDDAVLSANPYTGNGLDWTDFDLVTDASPGQSPVSTVGTATMGPASAPASPPETVTVTAIPTPVRFRGMPSSRFWELEDATVDFGAVESSPADPGRLMLVEFMTLYGTDWFVHPLLIPTGSLTSISQLKVADVFGRTFLLPSINAPAAGSTPAAKWQMFALHPTGVWEAGADALLLVPGAPQLADGPTIEEVALARDEVALLGWGIERIVADPTGTPVDRRSRWAATYQPQAATPPDEPARYLVETTVPDYWIPLVPIAVGNSVGLQVTPMESEDGVPAYPVVPQGRLLVDGTVIPDEEIGADGATVIRNWRSARWIGGTSARWVVRRKLAGQGEVSSGLRFDTLT
jgi:hypothetical protein